MRKTKNVKRKGTRPTQPRPIQTGERDVFSLDSEDVTPIVEFLESFRDMVDPRAQAKSKLISIKIPEPLLAAFKFKAKSSGVPYQTMIKRLMLIWLKQH